MASQKWAEKPTACFWKTPEGYPPTQGESTGWIQARRHSFDYGLYTAEQFS